MAGLHPDRPRLARISQPVAGQRTEKSLSAAMIGKKGNFTPPRTKGVDPECSGRSLEIRHREARTRFPAASRALQFDSRGIAWAPSVPGTTDQRLPGPNSLVAQQLRRVGAQKGLSPGSALDPGQHPRQRPDNAGVSESSGSSSNSGPSFSMADQNRPISLRVPSENCSSVCQAPWGRQCRYLPRRWGIPREIVPQIDGFQLGYYHLKGLPDPSETRIAGALPGPGDLLQEIAAEGVVQGSPRTFGVADELGHDVQVANGCEEGSQLAEGPVDAHLLQAGLSETLGIGVVFLIGAFDQFHAIAQDTLLADQRRLCWSWWKPSS